MGVLYGRYDLLDRLSAWGWRIKAACCVQLAACHRTHHPERFHACGDCLG